MRIWHRPTMVERWLIPIPPTPVWAAPEVKDRPPKVARRRNKRKWRLYCVHRDGTVHVDEFGQCGEGVKVRAMSMGMAVKIARGRRSR